MKTKAILTPLFLCLLLFGPHLAWAQSRSMERAHQVGGAVRIADTLAPARGAKVVLEQRGFIHGQTITGTSGKFHFNRVGPGEYTLVVSLDGFHTARTEVNVINSSMLGLNISLRRQSEPTPSGPPTIAVEALALSDEARRHQAQGLEDLRNGRWEEARARFDQVTALHPDFAGAHLGRGVACYFLQQLQPAEQALRKSLELDRNLLPAYVFLGRLLNDEQRSREARDLLETAMGLGPDRWDAYYELARALAAEEDFAQAEKSLLRAHELERVGPNVHLLLADVLLINNQPGAALAEMRHYLRLHPDGAFAILVRDRARSLGAELQDSGQPR